MSIRLAFECDGCNNVADSERLTRHFESLNGKGFGFGSWVMTPRAEES